MNKFIVFIFQLLLFAQLAFSASIYCDYTSGDDANDCTNGTTQLCKTLQRCVNVASRGDFINVADTSSQVLAGALTWTTGFNATGNNPITIQSWDNGGAITIQRPDEATARVAGSVTVGSSATGATATVIKSTVWKDIKFTGGSNRGLQLGETSACYGCEFDAIGTVPVEMIGVSAILENCYLHDSTTSFYNVLVSSTESRLFNNYFKNNTGDQIQPVVTSRSNIYNNIFILNHGVKAINTGVYYGEIYGNTFVSNGSANAIGILNNSGTAFPLGTIYNNIFYNFDGASAKPISVSSSGVGLLGYNTYFDCNANDAHTFIVADLTANDITGTGDPFVDSANDDYTLTVASGARGEALSNPNSSLDIGAVQSQGSGGGTINRFFQIGD